MSDAPVGSLRSLHLFLMVVVIIGSDLFGGWAIHDYRTSHDALTLTLGVASLAFGFGMIAYVIWFIRKLDRAHVQ